MTGFRASARIVTIVALLGCFLSLAGTASARTFSHGLNVWSDGVTLNEDDEVRGDVNVIFGTLTCDGPATIDGNVTVFWGTFDPTDQCSVRGTTSSVFGSNSVEAFAPWAANGTFFEPNRSLMRKLGWDLVVLIAFLLFPFRMRVALDRVEKHPGGSALVGGIALVATIPIAVLLLVSIIGIPLIPIEIAALFAALWIGQGAVALLVGRRLLELLTPTTTPAPLAALVVGLVLITAAELLPLVGWAVTAVVALAGLGAAILAFVRETAFHNFGARPAMAGQDINRA